MNPFEVSNGELEGYNESGVKWSNGDHSVRADT